MNRRELEALHKYGHDTHNADLPGRNEEERQRQLRETAMESAGSIQGNDPDRAESARSAVRSRIARRHGRKASGAPREK